LKSRMMAIESEYNLPNLNVLYVISKEVHETQDYSSKQFPYADLDSKLCLAEEKKCSVEDGQVVCRSKYSHCVLKPKLSDDNIEKKVVASKEEFFSAIKSHEGKIDVLYFFGHGDGNPSHLSFDSLRLLTPKALESVTESEKAEIRVKFTDKSIAILKSCLTLKNHEEKETIAEAIASFLDIPVIASDRDVVSNYYKLKMEDDSIVLKPASHLGGWKIVYPQKQP
ncbi:MAG: hypothetical protein ABIB71_01040, partial [Candidatus Woesearchaeota archaeon]